MLILSSSLDFGSKPNRHHFQTSTPHSATFSRTASGSLFRLAASGMRTVNAVQAPEGLICFLDCLRMLAQVMVHLSRIEERRRFARRVGGFVRDPKVPLVILERLPRIATSRPNESQLTEGAAPEPQVSSVGSSSRTRLDVLLVIAGRFLQIAQVAPHTPEAAERGAPDPLLVGLAHDGDDSARNAPARDAALAGHSTHGQVRRAPLPLRLDRRSRERRRGAAFETRWRLRAFRARSTNRPGLRARALHHAVPQVRAPALDTARRTRSPVGNHRDRSRTRRDWRSASCSIRRSAMSRAIARHSSARLMASCDESNRRSTRAMTRRTRPSPRRSPSVRHASRCRESSFRSSGSKKAAFDIA